MRRQGVQERIGGGVVALAGAAERRRPRKRRAQTLADPRCSVSSCRCHAASALGASTRSRRSAVRDPITPSSSTPAACTTAPQGMLLWHRLEQQLDLTALRHVTRGDRDTGPQRLELRSNSTAPSASPRRLASSRCATPCSTTRWRASSAPRAPVPPVISTVPTPARSPASALAASREPPPRPSAASPSAQPSWLSAWATSTTAVARASRGATSSPSRTASWGSSLASAPAKAGRIASRWSRSTSVRCPGYSDCAERIRPHTAANARSGMSSRPTATAPRDDENHPRVRESRLSRPLLHEPQRTPRRFMHRRDQAGRFVRGGRLTKCTVARPVNDHELGHRPAFLERRPQRRLIVVSRGQPVGAILGLRGPDDMRELTLRLSQYHPRRPLARQGPVHPSKLRPGGPVCRLGGGYRCPLQVEQRVVVCAADGRQLLGRDLAQGQGVDAGDELAGLIGDRARDRVLRGRERATRSEDAPEACKDTPLQANGSCTRLPCEACRSSSGSPARSASQLRAMVCSAASSSAGCTP